MDWLKADPYQNLISRIIKSILICINDIWKSPAGSDVGDELESTREFHSSQKAFLVCTYKPLCVKFN